MNIIETEPISKIILIQKTIFKKTVSIHKQFNNFSYF